MRHLLYLPIVLVINLLPTNLSQSFVIAQVSQPDSEATRNSPIANKSVPQFSTLPATAVAAAASSSLDRERARHAAKGKTNRPSVSVSQSATQESAPLSKKLNIPAKGVALRYPESWSVSSRKYGNAEELRNVAAEKRNDASAAGVAQIIITAEPRSSHAEALRELREIAVEVDASVTYLQIGGWPALLRHRKAPLAQRGERGEQDQEKAELSQRVTIAVAAGDQLVRVEAFIPPKAPPAVAAQAEAIGRSLEFKTIGSPAQVEREIQDLRSKPSLRPSLLFTPLPDGQETATQKSSVAQPPNFTPLSGAPEALEDSTGFARRVIPGASEIEVAVSTSGRNIVIATNTGGNYAFSTNGGQTFTQSSASPGFPIDGDPSLGVGASSAFYYGYIAFPDGSMAANGTLGCSTGISRSTNNGQSFTFRGNATLCPQTGAGLCFPDQEHITADRFNAAGGGGDQVYSVWRNFTPSGMPPPTCGGIGSGFVTPMLVCSTDGGQNWSAGVVIEAGGDFPRVTAGQDGRVYVTYRNGGNIRIRRYSSCANGLALQATATVAAFNDVDCTTLPGLDRCNDGNVLSSHTAAVDDTNPNHVYVAYASNTGAGNEDVFVRDSTDSGTNWPAARIVRVNGAFAGRRYMPWVCSVGGAAQVTWYDGRASTPCPSPPCALNNDLTDFFRGSAFVDGGGNLAAGTESKITDNADPTCASGWPCTVRSASNAETCSVQPQLAGRCQHTPPNMMDSNTPCDISGPDATICPATETCQFGGGCPKYGDYNGNACAAGRIYAAYASATAPQGQTNTGNIDTYFSASVVCCVPQIQVPGSVSFPDTCVGSSSTQTLNVCNTGKENLEVNSINSNNSQFTVTTPSSGFPVVISPDFCFPFQVKFTPTSTGSKSAILTVASNDTVNPSVTVQATGNSTQQNISTTIADTGDFGNVCVGSFKDLDLTITNTGGCDLSISNITSSSTEFKTAQTMSFPLVVQGGTSIHIPIRLEPTSIGAKSANITISSNDPDTPSKVVAVTGHSDPGDIRVSGSTDFGDVCPGTQAEKTISVCNVGACNLHVTSVSLEAGCTDFQIINNPFPATVSPDFCMPITIRFTPTSAGPKSCKLTITSDDPDTPVIMLTVTANTPAASIDVPPDQSFPPEVIQSIGSCQTLQPFPISNTGSCNLIITNITTGGTNAADFGLSGLPSFPIILEPGHIAGEGDLMTVFKPTAIDRDRLGTLSVTYQSDPITGATTTVTRALCGEGVNTGARVLVTAGGVPLAKVEKIHLQRINANRNKNNLDTVDNAMRLPLVTVTPTAPCGSFQYHREYGTVSNPIQLLPGSYQVTATAIVNGKRRTKTVGFDVTTCDFNPTIVVNLP